MIKKILEKIGRQQLAWLSRSQNDFEVINFGELDHRMGSGLILLPANLEEIEIILNKLDDLSRCFPDASFTYVIRDTHSANLPEPVRQHTIEINQDHLNAFGLPNKRFFKNLPQAKFDFLIDLNRDFNLCAAYISSKSGARMRICFGHPQRDPFYNFQVFSPGELPLAHHLDTMIKYLSQLLLPAGTSNDNLQPA